MFFFYGILIISDNMKRYKKKMIIILLIIGLLIYIYPRYLKRVEGNKLVDKNSPYYINDLYASSGTQYQKLDDIGKKVYDSFIEYSINHKNYLNFKISDYGCMDYNECFNELSAAHDAILYDHPELLNYSSYSASSDGETINVTLQNAIIFKIVDKIGEMRIEHLIDEIKNATKNMSEREKIKYVYDYIGSKATYDYTFMFDSKNQSAYNVFIRSNAVCAGFAKTAQLIFQNIGIESYIAYNESHMWNIIKFRDNYYYFDSTIAACNDPSDNFYYNGLRQRYMNNYSLEHSDWYPTISTNNMFDI